MKILNEKEFIHEVRNFVIWNCSKGKHGIKPDLKQYTLTTSQEYFWGRMCAELTMMILGGNCECNDGIYEKIKKILDKENLKVEPFAKKFSI